MRLVDFGVCITIKHKAIDNNIPLRNGQTAFDFKSKAYQRFWIELNNG